MHIYEVLGGVLLSQSPPAKPPDDWGISCNSVSFWDKVLAGKDAIPKEGKDWSH